MGTHATVVRPEKLRGRLFRAAEKLCRRYGVPTVLAVRDEQKGHGANADGN
jgi:hypothetical protein